MREDDSELVQKIIDERFLFESLVGVDDCSIQRLLQEVESEFLRDHLANCAPVRMSQMENELKAILLVVRPLTESGEMIIAGGKDTYF